VQRRGKNAVLFVAVYTRLKPVKRWSLRAAYLAATLATPLAALSAEPAQAHLDVRPGVVEAGQTLDLLVELPRLRPGRRPVALELEADGLDVASTRLVSAVGGDTRWRARVHVDAEPGSVTLLLRALYADARSVEVEQTLVVLPREDADAFPWATVVVTGAAALALAAGLLLLARRRA
jgi:hypothetical protein